MNMSELVESMSMIDVQKAILHLNTVQLDLFFTFGLRQTKWFFEKDYNRAMAILPEGAVMEGINFMGRIQARNDIEKKRYGFFAHDCTWSEANKFEGGGEVIKLVDLQKIFEVFELGNYTFDALTHVPKQFKEFYLNTPKLPS